MWDDSPDTEAALQRLGLDRQASLAEAKTAFRHKARALHPDHTPASEQTLLALADCIQAIRHLERSVPLLVDITLTAAEAARGLSRSIRHKGRSGVFRIGSGAKHGDIVAAVGEADFQARLVIHDSAATDPAAPASAQLENFVSEFATREPAARFAGWLRKAHSAA